MRVNPHANVRTTPVQRAYIQARTAAVAESAHERGVTETTLRRWNGRSPGPGRAVLEVADVHEPGQAHAR